MAWRLAKSVEETINQNLIRDGRKVDIENLQCRLNTTLTGEPIFVDNVIAFPLDGSFISSAVNSLPSDTTTQQFTEGYASLPVFIPRAK